MPTGSQGGLAVALRAALKESGGIWFGWSGLQTEAFSGHISFTREDGFTTATVDLGSLAGTLSELGTQGWEVFSVDHVVSYLDQQEADGKTRLVVEKMQVTAKRPQK